MNALVAEIVAAVEDAVVGRNISPTLLGTAELAAMGVLSRRGSRGRVKAKWGAEGTIVLDISLPGPTPIVERIAIQMS